MWGSRKRKEVEVTKETSGSMVVKSVPYDVD